MGQGTRTPSVGIYKSRQYKTRRDARLTVRGERTRRMQDEEELTEIDELFYRERRRVELRVKVQHLANVAQTVPCELHLASPCCYTLNPQSKGLVTSHVGEIRARRGGGDYFYHTADDIKNYCSPLARSSSRQHEEKDIAESSCTTVRIRVNEC